MSRTKLVLWPVVDSVPFLLRTCLQARELLFGTHLWHAKMVWSCVHQPFLGGSDKVTAIFVPNYLGSESRTCCAKGDKLRLLFYIFLSSRFRRNKECGGLVHRARIHPRLALEVQRGDKVHHRNLTKSFTTQRMPTLILWCPLPPKPPRVGKWISQPRLPMGGSDLGARKTITN